MSAKHAVLGLVIERPGYGYELAQRLEERFGAWGWEPTGVYALLRGMAERGELRTRTVTRGTSKPRVIYEVTPDGERSFAAWMGFTAKAAPFRQDFDLKLQFATPESLPGLMDESLAQEQACLDQMAMLTSSGPPSRPGAQSELSALAVVLLRDRDMAALQQRAEWLQNVRKMMKLILEQHTARR
jgi:DNA-binding PadR family transcriptional regulator